MAQFPLLVALSAIMGLSIFLSLPVVRSHRAQGRFGIGLNAVAIGILVFLLADIFSDVAALLVNPADPYLTLPALDLLFGVGVLGSFGLLLLVTHRPGQPVEPHPTQTALVIAAAMGFQNLTEGLVFGAAWAASQVGLSTVVFVGFLFQNLTEGFPIAAPFLGGKVQRMRPIVPLFLIGGTPAILGGVVGYFYSSHFLEILFDAVAIGAILYVLLPMVRGIFRTLADPEANLARTRLIYLGILAGFLLGFAVNAF